MSETVDRCFFCGEWFAEFALDKLPVKDNAGYVTKPACKSCLQKIGDRSRPIEKASKPKELLMEGGNDEGA